MATTAERFWKKVRIKGDCWTWTGSRSEAGYGRLRVGSDVIYAHRWSYEHYVGMIPDHMEIDHLCGVRHCVNPAHLDVVSHHQNMVRSWAYRRVVAQLRPRAPLSTPAI
jgi:hypothetical protein